MKICLGVYLFPRFLKLLRQLELVFFVAPNVVISVCRKELEIFVLCIEGFLCKRRGETQVHAPLRLESPSVQFFCITGNRV